MLLTFQMKGFFNLYRKKNGVTNEEYNIINVMIYADYLVLLMFLNQGGMGWTHDLDVDTRNVYIVLKVASCLEDQVMKG